MRWAKYVLAGFGLCLVSFAAALPLSLLSPGPRYTIAAVGFVCAIFLFVSLARDRARVAPSSPVEPVITFEDRLAAMDDVIAAPVVVDRWEEAARVCSVLLRHAEQRERHLAEALQDARDCLADVGAPADYIEHLDRALAPYRKTVTC